MRELPVIPKRKKSEQHPEDRPGNKAIATCGQCGRTVFQMEHYSCMDPDCPVQVKITY